MSLIRAISTKLIKPATAVRPAMIRSFASEAPQADSDVVVPEIVYSLEWVLHSPPPLHQFDESPIIVETWGPADPYHD